MSPGDSGAGLSPLCSSHMGLLLIPSPTHRSWPRLCTSSPLLALAPPLSVTPGDQVRAAPLFLGDLRQVAWLLGASASTWWSWPLGCEVRVHRGGQRSDVPAPRGTGWAPAPVLGCVRAALFPALELQAQRLDTGQGGWATPLVSLVGATCPHPGHVLRHICWPVSGWERSCCLMKQGGCSPGPGPLLAVGAPS